MDRRFFIGGAAALAAGGAYWLLNQPAGQSEITNFAAAQAQTNETVDWSHVTDMAIGAEDAPITMIEYASLTCPHCARFHTDVYPQLKADFIDTGKVRFIMREVYFDRFGLWGTMIARCGGDMRYWGLIDTFFHKQSEWRDAETPEELIENMRAIGRQAGITDAELDTCLQDQAQAEALVARFQAQMAEFDVSATPTFIINGEKYSNMGYDSMQGILNDAIGE